MRKVLYLSHATPEVYAIIRAAMPAGFELATLERDSDDVVLTPHISAGTRDALRTKMRALFANVERFYRGEPLQNRVF